MNFTFFIFYHNIAENRDFSPLLKVGTYLLKCTVSRIALILKCLPSARTVIVKQTGIVRSGTELRHSFWVFWPRILRECINMEVPFVVISFAFKTIQSISIICTLSSSTLITLNTFICFVDRASWYKGWIQSSGNTAVTWRMCVGWHYCRLYLIAEVQLK